MKNILITGGAGFIGSHLVDLLVQKKYEVIVIDNFSTGRDSNLLHTKKKITIKKANISRIGNWKSLFQGVDVVFHLAAQPLVRYSYQSPVETWSTNVMGTVHVLDSLRLLSKFCAAVFITTDKVYFNQEWFKKYYKKIERRWFISLYTCWKYCIQSLSSWSNFKFKF